MDNMDKHASISEVQKFFYREGDTLKQFSDEWKQLTDQDKSDLKAGIGNGTLNY